MQCPSCEAPLTESRYRPSAYKSKAARQWRCTDRGSHRGCGRMWLEGRSRKGAGKLKRDGRWADHIVLRRLLRGASDDEIRRVYDETFSYMLDGYFSDSLAAAGIRRKGWRLPEPLQEVC